jgi:hypothetical protein
MRSVNFGKMGKIAWLVGDGVPEVRPLGPYSEIVCDFLAELSEVLLRDLGNRAFPDVVTFAFFCRRANVTGLARGFGEAGYRLGRGLAFHITPSNIPINFAFSLVFGMLSGNSNLVRVPTKSWPQVDIVCCSLEKLLERAEFAGLRPMVAMVRYEQDDEITGHFSSLCDARIIWGGDRAVGAIRKLPIPPRCVEVTFADRYSCCVLGSSAIMDLDGPGLGKLADAFYNDTYLVDQNACSSPSLIIWLGDLIPEAKEKFWSAVEKSADKYDFEPIHATSKYTLLCEYLTGCYDIKSVTKHGNLIYRAELSGLGGVEECRGRFGLFFEYSASSMGDIAKFVTSRWQTLTYFGQDPDELAAFVTGESLMGIDRIVPVGASLDIGMYWDGFDLIGALSRIIMKC